MSVGAGGFFRVENIQTASYIRKDPQQADLTEISDINQCWYLCKTSSVVTFCNRPSSLFLAKVAPTSVIRRNKVFRRKLQILPHDK